MRLRNVYVVITLVLFSTCAKDPIELVESNNYGDELLLGQRISNPYTIDNINLALLELGRAKVQPNKKYVRFSISNEEEMTLLKSQIPLIFDHPLDFEVKENGSFYLEEGFDNKEKKFYAVVDADFQISSQLSYELLSELYIPKDVDVELESKAFERVGLPFNNSNAGKGASGIISFEEITDGNIVPLQDLKIVAREWFRFEVVKTDALGNFNLKKSYFATAEIYVQFDNHLFEFRTLTEDNILLVLLPNLYLLGNYDATKPMNILLNGENFNNSNLLMTASAYSAYYDYIEFSALNDMLVPDAKLLVWMAENDGLLSTGNAAPMLKALASDDLKNIRTLLKELFNLPDALANPVSNILKNDVPDLFLLYDERFPTQKEATWFHEYAHAGQFAQVGAKIWLPYIQHIVRNLGYGGPGEPSSGIIALSEAWAEDASQFCHEWKFGYAQEDMESLGPNEADWIPYGIYYDLFDDNNDVNEEDEVSGYTLAELYAQLTSDINSPELLKESLITATNDEQKIEAINTLFENYGY